MISQLLITFGWCNRSLSILKHYEYVKVYNSDRFSAYGSEKVHGLRFDWYQPTDAEFIDELAAT